jgi:hypothetical protein
MLIELCNYCNKYLGVLIVNGKPCCQFCEKHPEDKENTQKNKKIK